MAGYRQFHTKFWKDDYLIELDPLERYLFSYLFTNELSSISGIYKIPFRVIVNETGLEKDFIEKTLAKFQEAKKIMYKDGVMWVVNMARHHANASPRTMVKVNNDLAEIGDCEVKRAYLYHKETGEYPIDTVSIGYGYDSLKSKAQYKAKAEAEGVAAPLIPQVQNIDLSRVFCKVTEMIAVPGGEIPKVLPALEALQTKYFDENELIDYLIPFYQAWIKRKTKDGRIYSRSNCTWLYDWAVSGAIPEDGGKDHKTTARRLAAEVIE